MGGRNAKYKDNENDSGRKVKHPPTPPRKTKKQLIKDQNAFKDIDSHALQASRLVERSVDTLSEYLVKNTQNDLQKVRVIYRWITDRISYDTTPNFHQRNTSTDSKAVLNTRKTVCIGYANLFRDLCEKVGVTVEILSGYSKGRSYKPEDVFTTEDETDHAWNAVRLYGDWYLLDCTWGAGSVDDHGEWVKKFSEFHFLTNPKHFVVSHFPYMDEDLEKSKKWQLLKKPIDLTTFGKRIKGTQYMYEWGIKSKSHRNGIIEFQKCVDIVLEYPKNDDVLIMCRLYDERGRNCDQHSAITRHGSRCFRVRIIPPNVGEYKLNLLGRDDPEVAEMLSLTTYFLKCTSVDENVLEFPKHVGVWGPYHDYIDGGFHKSVCRKPELVAKKGQVQLKLKTTKPVNAMVKMEHATKRINESLHYAILEKQKDLLIVNIRFPVKGYFKVSIFTKNDNNNSTYSPRLCYLVYCKECMENPQTFPKLYPQTTDFSCHLVEPKTAEIPAHSKVKFRFSSPTVVQAIVGGQKMKQSGKMWEATLSTEAPGHKLRMSGNDKEGDNYFGLYEFNVM